MNGLEYKRTLITRMVPTDEITLSPTADWSDPISRNTVLSQDKYRVSQTLCCEVWASPCLDEKHVDQLLAKGEDQLYRELFKEMMPLLQDFLYTAVDNHPDVIETRRRIIEIKKRIASGDCRDYGCNPKTDLKAQEERLSQVIDVIRTLLNSTAKKVELVLDMMKSPKYNKSPRRIYNE